MNETQRKRSPTDPEERVEADGHPVGQELLHYGLGSAEKNTPESEH